MHTQVRGAHQVLGSHRLKGLVKDPLALMEAVEQQREKEEQQRQQQALAAA